jgi:hypothetical protein
LESAAGAPLTTPHLNHLVPRTGRRRRSHSLRILGFIGISGSIHGSGRRGKEESDHRHRPGDRSVLLLASPSVLVVLRFIIGQPYQPLLVDLRRLADDAMAIFVALRSPELEVIGLTTTFGNVHTALATHNALHLVRSRRRPHPAPSLSTSAN